MQHTLCGAMLAKRDPGCKVASSKATTRLGGIETTKVSISSSDVSESSSLEDPPVMHQDWWLDWWFGDLHGS